MIADDEQCIRLLLRNVLEEMGLDLVGEARNGHEAVALFKKARPDLMLLDVHMPIQDGCTTLLQIRKEFPEAKVIMLTAAMDPKLIKWCASMGATHYILKTNTIAKIQEMLRKTLNLSS